MIKRYLLVLALLLAAASTAFAIDRGLCNPRSTYIPKGTVALGLSGNYHSYNANGEQGYALYGLVTGLTGQITTAGASANLACFVADNMSLGVRFNYANTGIDVDNASLMSLLTLTNKHVAMETYTGSLAFRGYLPLFNSKVLALFGEVRMNGSLGYNKNYENSDRGKVGSYADVYSLSLGLYPGVSVFVTDAIAFEVSLPLLEGGYEWNQQIQGEAHDADTSHAFAQFQPSILGLNLGITIHF